MEVHELVIEMKLLERRLTLCELVDSLRFCDSDRFSPVADPKPG